MAERRTRCATVIRRETVTPGMVRVVLGGPELEGLGVGAFTDHYVKLQFPAPGADYAPPFDVAQVRDSRPREQWAHVRTYTVRGWDETRGELTIDFVVHGDGGVAGPWAAAAQPGDRLQFGGPGGAYTPDPAADWHLMAGDTSVIPAISASLERVPPGVPVHVFLELDDPDDRQPLDSPGDLHVEWLDSRDGEDVLVEAVQRLAFPAGAVHAFVHGEASAVRAVRRHLLVDRGVPAAALSASGYWKRDRTEDGWREDKAEWKRLAEADLLAAGPSSTAD